MNNLRDKLLDWQREISTFPLVTSDSVRAHLKEFLTSLPAEPFAVVTESEWKEVKNAAFIWNLHELVRKQFEPPKPRRRYVLEPEGEPRIIQLNEWYDFNSVPLRAASKTSSAYQPLTRYNEVFRNGEWVREG